MGGVQEIGRLALRPRLGRAKNGLKWARSDLLERIGAGHLGMLRQNDRWGRSGRPAPQEVPVVASSAGGRLDLDGSRPPRAAVDHVGSTVMPSPRGQHDGRTARTRGDPSPAARRSSRIDRRTEATWSARIRAFGRQRHVPVGHGTVDVHAEERLGRARLRERGPSAATRAEQGQRLIDLRTPDGVELRVLTSLDRGVDLVEQRGRREVEVLGQNRSSPRGTCR